MPSRRACAFRRHLRATVPAAVLLVLGGRMPLRAQGEAPADAPYLNPSLPVEQRVKDLVSRMTLEEKASQMRDHAAAIPRLHVADYAWWSEAAHGVAAPAFHVARAPQRLTSLGRIYFPVFQWSQ